MINIGVLYFDRLAANLCGECFSYDARFLPHGVPPCSHSSNQSSSVVLYMLSKFHTPQCVIKVLNLPVLTANQFIMYPPNEAPAAPMRSLSIHGCFSR